MRAAVGDLGQRRITVPCRSGGEALVGKNARNEIANICFVIDNQNVTCHGSRLCCQLLVAALIFASSLVASVGSAVPDSASFVCFLAFRSFAPAFVAWPDNAKRNPIHAPPRPGPRAAP